MELRFARLNAGLLFRIPTASENSFSWTVISRFPRGFFDLTVNAGVVFKIYVAMCVSLEILQTITKTFLFKRILQ
jgi:hypothetical protein